MKKFNINVNYFSNHADRFSVHLRMLSVVVIGTGNVARQLCLAWQDNSTVKVVQVVGRTPDKDRILEGHKVTSIGEIVTHADCYIIAVSDSAIATVSQDLTVSDVLVVHTSGSVSIDALKEHHRRAVLYPLQTMSSGREVDFTQIPVFLETFQDGDRAVLEQLADSLSDTSYWIDSVNRRQLHVTAVFLNNFTNHLHHLAELRCKEVGIDPSVLQPLLEETVSKAIEMGPYRAQTGPARRGDLNVMEDHIKMIEDRTQREIYRILSQSIQSTYENELQKLT